MNPHESRLAPGGLGAGKIRPEHLRLLAVVYVRQSTPQQVLEHRESTARQYELADVAQRLGWPTERIVVIDEDQGQSGQTAEGRAGFQRLLAEISLGHVGMVFCLEVSRLARSCKDWHQLLEVCGIFGALLADQDGVYDPSHYNDRLVLGLKGTMSEAELHVLQGRLAEGRRQKALRGELRNHPPMGYVRSPNGDYEFDPDERVQTVMRLVFDQFEQQRTTHGLLRYLVHHHIKLPVRPHAGPQRGELQWRRPCRETLQNVLKNPIYAGAYCWGRRQVDPRKKKPGRRSTGRTVQAPEACLSLIRDRYPAYISWERFQANQQRLADNQARGEAKGAPREGVSLLAGLMYCGRCGRRMSVHYQSALRLSYNCSRAMVDYAEPMCQSLSGQVLEDWMAEQVLQIVQPCALEASLAASVAWEAERNRLTQQWKQRLEEAAYQTQRAQRQYDAVEPENRLVARGLERRWEEALQAEQQLQQEYDRWRSEQPSSLTSAQRQEIRALAQDLPRLWRSSAMTAQDRQQIVRLLVSRVEVRIEGDSEQVLVRIRWAGDCQSEHWLTRSVNSYEQLSYYSQMCERIASLQQSGAAAHEIAARLNEDGYRPPKRARCFTAQMVQGLLANQGRRRRIPQTMKRESQLDSDEWWLTDLARELSMPIATLTKWRIEGWVHSRKLPVAGGRWALWADADELSRLRALRRCSLSWKDREERRRLIVPKPRPDRPEMA